MSISHVCLSATAGAAAVQTLPSYAFPLCCQCCPMASSSPKTSFASLLNALLLLQRRQLMELSQAPGQQGSAAHGSVLHSSPHLQNHPECVSSATHASGTDPLLSAPKQLLQLAHGMLRASTMKSVTLASRQSLIGTMHLHLGKHVHCIGWERSHTANIIAGTSW